MTMQSLRLKIYLCNVFSGNSAELVCDYDPENDQIYSVKWYKGNQSHFQIHFDCHKMSFINEIFDAGGREIFRYLPSSKETVTIYPRLGVNIDQVRLQPDLETKSLFRYSLPIIRYSLSLLDGNDHALENTRNNVTSNDLVLHI
jgi:hypothetical protein